MSLSFTRTMESPDGLCSMKGLRIEPSTRGAYAALCHLGDSYVPLDQSELERLREVADASPEKFYDVLLDVVGATSYLREKVVELWASGDPGEQSRRLQDAVKRIPNQ